MVEVTQVIVEAYGYELSTITFELFTSSTVVDHFD